MGRIKKGDYPSFGCKEMRELKLINEEVREVPGPGKYDIDPFNLEDLLR